MLGERQVAAPLMAQRAADGALRSAHRRLQPGAGVGVQLARLRLSREPQLLSPCQLGHEALVLGFALFTPAAPRPGHHRAVRRQRGRKVAPCGHTSTVGQAGGTQTANNRALRLAAKLGFTEVERFEEWGAEQWFGVWSSVTLFG